MADTTNDVAIEFQKIYDSEINIRISSFWDCGIEVRLGDEMNGYVARRSEAHGGENGGLSLANASASLAVRVCRVDG